MPRKQMTVEELRFMSPTRRRKFFDRCTKEEMEAVTEPCTGEAHDPACGGMIDHCGVCMNTSWGRQLKQV